MLGLNDFNIKQIVIVSALSGEKLSFKNDNLVVRTKDDKIKFQITCYRLFAVFVIGHISITSGLIMRAEKFKFSILLFTPSFRLYSVISESEIGNTLLRKKQYLYSSLDLARHITANKISNQIANLKSLRAKDEILKDAIIKIENNKALLKEADSLSSIMAYEGIASKLYFKNYFDIVCWHGRKPRTKCDIVNTLLDIGYAVLFNFVEAILRIYGFDMFVGVMHREFYMRKSLVCDIIEPFRCIIERQIRSSVNLRQFKEEDFLLSNNAYVLKYDKSIEYTAVFLNAAVKYKSDIFVYIREYYRSFMKGDAPDKFPTFNI